MAVGVDRGFHDMQRNPHSRIADRGHHLTKLNRGSGPSLAEHRRVTPPWTPRRRSRQSSPRFCGKLDSRPRADAEFLHVLISLGIGHFVADLYKTRIVGLCQNARDSHLLGAVRIVVVDLLAVGHLDRIGNREDARGRDLLLVDGSGKGHKLSGRSRFDGGLDGARTPVRRGRLRKIRGIRGTRIDEGEHLPCSDFDDDGRAPLGVVGLDRIVDRFHKLILQVAVDCELDRRPVLSRHFFALAVRQDGAATGDFDRSRTVLSRESGLVRLLDPRLAFDLPRLVFVLPCVP